MVAHQLRHIFITRGNNRFDTLFGGLLRQGTDHVISLDTFNHKPRQSHRVDNVVDRLNLHSKIIWHRRAIRLVLAIHIVAKGFAFGIKYDHDFAVCIVLLQRS